MIEDDEDEDFEKFLAGLDEEPEEGEDPDEDEFAINDRFIRDFEDGDDMDMYWFLFDLNVLWKLNENLNLKPTKLTMATCSRLSLF